MRRAMKILIPVLVFAIAAALVWFFTRPKDLLSELRPYMTGQMTSFAHADMPTAGEVFLREREIDVRGLSEQQLVRMLHESHPISDGWDWVSPEASCATKPIGGMIGYWRDRSGPDRFHVVEQLPMTSREVLMTRVAYLGRNPFAGRA